MVCNESVRHQMPSTETMTKYFAEIERMVFAAEIYCEDTSMSTCYGTIPYCPFKCGNSCTLYTMRCLVGEHII